MKKAGLKAPPYLPEARGLKPEAFLLRSASLARGRRLSRGTLGLAARLPLRGAAVLAAAQVARRLAQALAETLAPLRRFALFPFGRFRLFRRPLAANQLDLRRLGAIAAAEADAQDARVAARPIREPRRQLREQLADDLGIRNLGKDETPRVERPGVGVARGH